MKDISEKEDKKMERVTFLQFYLKCLEKRLKIYGNIYNSYPYGWALLPSFTFLDFKNSFSNYVFLAGLEKIFSSFEPPQMSNVLDVSFRLN